MSAVPQQLLAHPCKEVLLTSQSSHSFQEKWTDGTSRKKCRRQAPSGPGPCAEEQAWSVQRRKPGEDGRPHADWQDSASFTPCGVSGARAAAPLWLIPGLEAGSKVTQCAACSPQPHGQLCTQDTCAHSKPTAARVTTAREREQPKCPWTEDGHTKWGPIHSGVAFSLKKVGNPDTCYHVDETWGCYAA